MLRLNHTFETLKSKQINWSLDTALPAFDIDNLIEQAHHGIGHEIK